MKRVAFSALFCVSLAVVLSLQSYLWSATHASTSGEHCYVLVERTGMDVTCSTWTKTEEVKTRTDAIQQENADRDKFNKELKDEVAKLTTKLSQKKTELAKAKDDGAKADIQKDVDDLKTQINDKKATAKLHTTWDPPKSFSKRADADKYIEKVTKDAETAKEQAAAREAKAKGKE